MPSEQPTSMRLSADIKEALQRAAADNDRTLSNMAEIIFKEWLRARGYLKER